MEWHKLSNAVTPYLIALLYILFISNSLINPQILHLFVYGNPLK